MKTSIREEKAKLNIEPLGPGGNSADRCCKPSLDVDLPSPPPQCSWALGRGNVNNTKPTDLLFPNRNKNLIEVASVFNE